MSKYDIWKTQNLPAIFSLMLNNFLKSEIWLFGSCFFSSQLEETTLPLSLESHLFTFTLSPLIYHLLKWRRNGMQLLRPESIHVSCWEAIKENFGEQMSPIMFELELFTYSQVHLHYDNGVLLNAFKAAVKVCKI